MRNVSPKKEYTTIQEVLPEWGKGTTPSLAESRQLRLGLLGPKRLRCVAESKLPGSQRGRKRLTVLIRRKNCFRSVLPKYARSLERGKRGIAFINTEGIKNPQEVSIPSKD